MRYLSLLLLGPWLVILAWIYWACSRSFHTTWPRKLYDTVTLTVALLAAAGFALMAYDAITVQNVGGFGRESGGIWKQVMPALYAYGAFALVIVAGLLGRRVIRRRRGP